MKKRILLIKMQAACYISFKRKLTNKLASKFYTFLITFLIRSNLFGVFLSKIINVKYLIINVYKNVQICKFLYT